MAGYPVVSNRCSDAVAMPGAVSRVPQRTQFPSTEGPLHGTGGPAATNPLVVPRSPPPATAGGFRSDPSHTSVPMQGKGRFQTQRSPWDSRVKAAQSGTSPCAPSSTVARCAHRIKSIRLTLYSGTMTLHIESKSRFVAVLTASSHRCIAMAVDTCRHCLQPTDIDHP